MRDRRRLVARLAVAIAAAGFSPPAGPAAAAAQPDLEALVAGPSTCPRPDLVLAELATLLPPDRLGPRLRALPGTPPVVELVDLGAPFQVVVAGRVREYRDEARDCAHRARVAAVFVALTIDPASVAMPPAAPPPPPPPVIVSEAPPAPAPPARARLDVAAALDAGVGSGDPVAQPGASVRLALGRGRLAFAAGALALVPVNTSAGDVSLRQWRLPLDAGVRASLAPGRFTPYGELGLCAAVVSASARDLSSAGSGTAIEFGARAAIGLRAGASRFAPFAALHAAVIPRPVEIYALPRGVAGHTPTLWIGASAGVSLELSR